MVAVVTEVARVVWAAGEQVAVVRVGSVGRVPTVAVAEAAIWEGPGTR